MPSCMAIHGDYMEARLLMALKVVGVTMTVHDTDISTLVACTSGRKLLHLPLPVLPMHTYGFGSRNQVICVEQIVDRQGSLIP